MRKVVLAVAATAALVAPAPAAAITYGEPDGDTHANVGAVFAEHRTPGRKDLLCSGTLISETVFLTAAHCTRKLESLGIPPDRIWVSFARDVDPLPAESQLVRGSWVTNPEYDTSFDDTHDLAVINLFKRQKAPPASLPRRALLDDMRAAGQLSGQKFTAVGYGVHEPEIGGGPPSFPYDGERWRAVGSFNALTPAWLKLSQNDATQDGGTCSGDSGGPNFLGTGDATVPGLIASITVSGDAMCLASNSTYRLDTDSARRFLGLFVLLP